MVESSGEKAHEELAKIDILSMQQTAILKIAHAQQMDLPNHPAKLRYPHALNAPSGIPMLDCPTADAILPPC